MIRFSPVLAMALSILIAGCKTPEATARKYEYLLKDGSSRTTAPSKAPKARKYSSKDVRVDDESDMDRRRTESRATEFTKLDRVLKEAKTYLGVPYRYGGINRNGIDCSGLIANAYQTIDIPLPRSSKAQSEFGIKVNRNSLAPGDLVFFDSKGNGKINHVGMVTEVVDGEVTFIHATTSQGVRYDRLDKGYWVNKYVTGRRPRGS